MPAKVALEAKAQAKARTGSLDPSQPEHRFVLFVVGKEKKLGLGEMHRVLAATLKSREGVSSDLRVWLTRIPRWEELVDPLGLIVAARNPAMHAEDDVEKMPIKFTEAASACWTFWSGSAFRSKSR